MKEEEKKVFWWHAPIGPCLVLWTLVFSAIILTLFGLILSIYYPLNSVLDPVDCGAHGNYAFFLTTHKCICHNGWTGDLCADAVSTADYYPVVYADEVNLTVSVMNITLAACNQSCLNDTDCRGFIYNDCYADYCGTKRCERVYDQPDRRYPATWLTYPYVGHDVHPFDEDLLYLRNPGKCTSPFCYYNPTYGVVASDEQNYWYSHFGLEFEVYPQMNLTSLRTSSYWQNITTSMGGYVNVPKGLDHVVEFTNAGILQMPMILTDTSFEIDSLTVVSPKGESFKNQISSDYGFSYKGHTLEVNVNDYGQQLLPVRTIQKYDTVILTDALYFQKDISVFLANVYEMLDRWGVIIMRDTEWIDINETVIVNYCTGAGMPKKAYIDAFLAKFDVLYYHEDPLEIEPSSTETGSFVGKTTGYCWIAYPDQIPPNHTRKYFSFIGRKK